MNLAMADSYIAGFKIRYVYDFWRPVTAIREGDTDGNDATAGDPTLEQPPEHPERLGLPLDPEHLQRGGGRSARGCPRAPTRWPSRSRAGHPSRTSRARSRASRRRRGRARTPGSTPASTSARRARTGSMLGRKIGERAVALYLQPVKK